MPEQPLTGMAEPVSTLDMRLRSVAARKPGATAVVAPGGVALDLAGLAGQVDGVRAALTAAPADDLAPILDALPGPGDEQARRVIGARDDWSQG